MSQNNIIPAQKIDSAAAGNAALRELLQSVVQNQQVQTLATNTASGKPVPPQVTAAVSYLEKSYIVQIQNPGAATSTSALQSAQASAGSSLTSNLAPITAIYHQIRCATTPQFNISSNVQTFGGDTGSTQTYWTLTGLGSGRFYFQIRSSYDGVNFNLWRNANGGQTITKNPDGVTAEAVNNAVWAAFTLPGDQLCAFGAGFVPNGGSFDVATNLYTSGMQAIPGMNGFTQTGDLSSGVKNNAIGLQTPSTPQSLTGPADYPAVVTENYEDGADGDRDIWDGSANIFGFAYDPLGTNVNYYSTSTGGWAVFTLPGGSQMAVGSGVVPSGTALIIPAEMPWFDVANMIGIATPNNAFSNSHHAHGLVNSGFTGLVANAIFQDGEGNQWAGTANWFAIAFSPGIALQPVTGGRFVVFDLPSGTSVAIGQGLMPSGSSFDLPAGFTADQTLSIGVPAGFNDTGHAMAGVAHCSISGTTARLVYQDGAQNFWDGMVSWFCFAWQ